MQLALERQNIVDHGKKMVESGLVKSTGGNLSLSNKDKSLLAITPTRTRYETMQPEGVGIYDLQGNQVDGLLKPSSEIQFHMDLINLRPDIYAVVHTHSPHATTLACLGWELPAIHYLIGHAGYKVPVAPYATFGTKELSESICTTMGSGNAVLMANHGLVTVGESLEKAFHRAEMVEYVAQLYLQARAVGTPIFISTENMDIVIQKYSTYAQ